MPSDLQIQVLGGFRVFHQGRPVTGLDSPRVQSLLAYLLLHRGQPQPRQRLAFLLYPDSTESQARTNLRSLVHRVRHALPHAERYLRVGTQDLEWLAEAAFGLDVGQFEVAAQATSATALEDALRSYSGDLLPDVDDDWVVSERERLRLGHLDVLERLVALLKAQGDLRRGIRHAHHLLRLDPLRESAYMNLIELYSMAGDRAGGERTYQELLTILRRELDAEPSAQTRKTYEEFIKAPARPNELVEAPLPKRHNLPTPLTSFIGREHEIDQVRQRLSETRLVTLTGVGGSGKTRLALEVAARVLDDSEFGVWLVDLGSITSLSLVPQAVAEVLAVKEEPGQTLLHTLGDYIREKGLLLILDNCEHLISACAELAAHILMTGSRSRILATSREALGVPGEQTWPLAPLKVPNPEDFAGGQEGVADRLGKFESVRLFAERAALAVPFFELNDANAQWVGQICNTLDGIPLAIELAASRARVLDVERIAARLKHSPSLLTGGGRTAQPRHQTLRAALDWSYNLLTGDEQLLFRRLSVFAGGLSLEAAEAVCGDADKIVGSPPERLGRRASRGKRTAPQGLRHGDVLDLLARLVEKSLVNVAQDASGSVRFRLLGTVRQYAFERLVEAGERDSLRSRHLRFYQGLVTDMEPKLYGAEQWYWFEVLDRDQDNLRAALEWPLESGAGGPSTSVPAAPAMQLAGVLRRYWFVRGRLSEGRRWLAQLLSLPVDAAHGEGRAGALNAAGFLAWAQGDTTAETLLEEAQSLARASGHTRDVAFALMYRGAVSANKGYLQRGRSLLEESLLLWRQIGDPQSIASALAHLGDVHFLLGEYARAQELYEESAGQFREVGDKNFLAYVSRRLGYALLRQAEWGRTASLFMQSLTLNTEIGDRRGMVAALAGLANTAVDLGEWARAARLYGVVQAQLEAMAVSLLPLDRLEHDRHLATLRLRAAKPIVDTAWAEGQAMTWKGAMEYAGEGPAPG